MTEILKELFNKLHEKKLSLVTAESCTGGWVAKVMTDMAGSSAIFDRGFVTYSNQAKQDMLDVSIKTLEQFGAVSEQVVIEMVEGALYHSQADVALSISGIAGPSGGTDEKPVGTVCFGWMKRGVQPLAKTVLLEGNRDAIRKQAVEFSLRELLEKI